MWVTINLGQLLAITANIVVVVGGAYALFQYLRKKLR